MCDAARRATSRFDVRGRWPDHFRELPLVTTLLEHGMYGPILSRWMRVLGRDRLLVVPLALLVRGPEEAIVQVLEFLGIQGGRAFASAVAPAPAERWPSATAADRAPLECRYVASDRQLAAELGPDSAPWL